MEACTCPNCGSTNVHYGEYVYARRRIVGVAPDGTVQVDGLIDEFGYEDTKDAHVWCMGCEQESSVPQAVEWV
jgi:hypothetical protein